ncbi:ABC transporter substrate-binding protein [Desulfobacula phenolica]|uniref:NitT/TauT family transport system substrate-binding protein n=1 Tax=Desulfobacula phenolica TaxID=90732 RepID=A0A1H2K3L5_9BACT|nr:ABC transporter substrate-binding protein [Desulfobacula phenolica]SDU63310.1 NitT/TauT family transport system substrate-binding protein [Desulfobacula phenolica]
MNNKPNIKIGYLNITDHLILGVTERKILKRDEIFKYSNIETRSFVDWGTLSIAFSRGDINAAFMLAPLAMDHFRKGEDIRLILLGHKNGSVLITNKSANINNINDFKGKDVLIPFHLSIHNMLLHKLLKDNNMGMGIGKDVEVQTVAPSKIPTYMEIDKQGKIGGFLVAEPFGSNVIKAGLGDEFELSKNIWPDHPCCVLVIKTDIIRYFPDAVQELTNSLVKSGKFIKNNIKEAARIGVFFLNQDIDVIERVLTSPADRITTDNLMPQLEDFEKIQDYITKEMGSIHEKINLEEFVYTKFAEEAGAT